MTDSRITSENLDEWEALADNATRGPWGVNEAGDQLNGAYFDHCCMRRDDQERADMAFAAASREAVPALIAEVRRLRDAAAQEPTDAEVKAAARALNAAGFTCSGAALDAGGYDECEECRFVCDGLTESALSAARAARRDEEQRR
ncbi:hypothetical protein ACXET9_07160 [Brachybacterium sp. DNPG3]